MLVSNRKKFLMGPGVLDCNRGDQALVWEAIDVLRECSENCEIAIMSDIYDDPEDNQSCQSRELGIQILPLLLPNPRRAATKDRVEIIDTGWFLVKMQVRAVLDFIEMCILLLLPRTRILARILLGKDRYRTYEFFRQCDAFVIKGGGYIYAYRGLRYAYYCWFGLFPLILARRCGVRVIILPNSFGPFDTRWGKWLTRKALENCNLVTVREPESLHALAELIPGKAKLYPDMAFRLIPEDRNWAKAELINHGVSLGVKPCVGITMRPYRFPNSKNPREKYSQYIEAFAKLIEYLSGNRYKPVLFAHVIGPHSHEDDRVAIENVLQAVCESARPFYIDGNYNCRQIKSLYGLMDFMVCTRFHSAIFSIAQQVPCLAISYQGYKATGIMREIGLEDFVLPMDAVDEVKLIGVFKELVANQQIVRQKMNTYTIKCQQRLNQMRDLIRVELDK